ncbi:MFS transporter [Clostridium sp. UBA6640]|uniref:MFS transporter n=1 Tax=Clostridium sp. UBA6640 TaxID=1946370 RepID=UPI0025C7281F|nr:MFS transporter [Clostridium sp. UBA6640]
MNFKLLKQKDFLLLMLGKLVSLIGSEMQGFALSLYVLKITGSATKFASVLSITLIPKLILGPIAGVIIDWIDRKKVIVYLDMLSGIIIGIYAVLYIVNGELSLGSIYVLAVLLSFISLLFQPAINTVLPSIVEKEELAGANGINSLVMSIGNLIAPAVAGFIFGIYGMSVVLIVNSISFILSSISEMFINIPKVNNKPEKININTFVYDFSQGIKFIKDKKIIANIIVLACIVNFAVPPISSIGLAFISKQILKITDYQYGMLQCFFVASMMVATFVINKVTKKITIGKIIFLDIFITSILIAVMAIIPSTFYLNLFSSNLIPYISLIIIIFMIGLIISIGNIALGTMFQQEVPLEIMGRVGTVMSSISMAAMPLGQMLFGFLFDEIEAWMCIAIASSIFLIVSLIFKKSLCADDENDKLIVDNNKVPIGSPGLEMAINEDMEK